MLTYTFEKHSGVSLYEQLFRHIKVDILSGRLTAGEKLPSKRTLSSHLELSVITVKNAYEQLIAEGYIYSEEKRGYFVSRIERPLRPGKANTLPEREAEPSYELDLVTNSISAEYFPFTVWSKTMRQTILEQDTGLLQPPPFNGAPELRRAIAENLQQFRGMTVDPEQIVIGAGTEFLYYLLIQLLGRDRTYAVEDPGYGKIGRIYESNQVTLRRIALDDAGLSADALRQSGADVVHISPSHHYPTGIVMPIARRQELLCWADEQPDRYILEDDYDSEFRFVGRPIPTMFSTDRHERVIYLNTFSKTIAPSIRISYMILPPHLLAAYRERLSFYACTVSSFEQQTLAAFMAQGRYEQHINRMRNRYRQKRDAVIESIRTGPLAGKVEIMEQDAGLHFLMHLDTPLGDDALRRAAAQKGVRLALLSDYYYNSEDAPQHVVVVNYSGIELDALRRGLARLAELWED